MVKLPRIGSTVVVTTTDFDKHAPPIQSGKIGVVVSDGYGENGWFHIECEDGYFNCYKPEQVEYVYKLDEVLS